MGGKLRIVQVHSKMMEVDKSQVIVSPSLSDSYTALNPDFDLGMCDWLSDSPVPPQPKRLRLSLAHSREKCTTPL